MEQNSQNQNNIPLNIQSLRNLALQNNNNSNNNQHNIFQNNNDINNSDDYSFSRYTKAIKTGLKTIGDTSYLNAVLFCLGNIRNLASFFLNPKNQNYINNQIGNMPISYVFERLLIHFYPYPEKENKEIYEPSSLLSVLSKFNIIYNSFQRRNPNDLIIFILNTLNKELNQAKNDVLHLNINIYDKHNVIKNGIKKFKMTEDSIISKNFNWFEIKESKCTQCNNTEFEFQTFNTLSLELEKSYLNIQNQKNFLSIYDCLDYYNTTFHKKFFCKKCNNFFEMPLNTRIYCSPNNFIFLLDRGIDFTNNNKLLSIPFQISEKIELGNFIENEKSPKRYELIGLVSIDIKSESRPYLSFCMSPVDKNWYCYNSENSNQIDIMEIIERHNNFKELIPCILIYKTIDKLK